MTESHDPHEPPSELNEANQDTLNGILNICKRELSQKAHDRVVYLRTNDKTISIHGNNATLASETGGENAYSGVV